MPETPVVSDTMLKLYADLATPTIANALDDVAFDGILSGIGQIVGGTRCVGRAVTVAQVSATRGAYASEEFKVGHMIDRAAPGDVIVVDNAGREVSSWGGLATYAAKVKGIGGLVVDGGVRDREEMEQHRLPVFARHMTPLTGRTRIRITDFDVPVTCGGVRVRPGDVIVGDGSGVVCIPAEHAERVAELAMRYAADDRLAEGEIKRGLTFREAMARFKRI
ncbi:MAG: hypothetical protein R3D27_14230 [Hyphomicrobiaceae bacterium]